MTDLDALVPAIVLGDPVAFGRWVAGAERTLREGLRPFAAVVDCEAVLQEALLRVWQVAPRFEPDGRPLGLVRLAARIARNLAVSEARRYRTAPADLEDLEARGALAEDALASVVPSSPDPLLARTLSECRESLPPKPAQALTERLRSGGAEPDEVLAERLGMRPNTFLQNFTRARKLLADCLEARGVDLDAELR